MVNTQKYPVQSFFFCPKYFTFLQDGKIAYKREKASKILSSAVLKYEKIFIENWLKYKARHAHKRLYTVLPKYSQIRVLPGIISCRLMKYNEQAIELNSLLINNMPKDGYE